MIAATGSRRDAAVGWSRGSTSVGAMRASMRGFALRSSARTRRRRQRCLRVSDARRVAAALGSSVGFRRDSRSARARRSRRLASRSAGNALNRDRPAAARKGRSYGESRIKTTGWDGGDWRALRASLRRRTCHSVGARLLRVWSDLRSRGQCQNPPRSAQARSHK